MTGTVLSTSASIGTRLRINIETMNSDVFAYFVDNGDPLDFPVNSSMSYDGEIMTINGIDYQVGRYDQTLNITELTAI